MTYKILPTASRIMLTIILCSFFLDAAHATRLTCLDVAIEKAPKLIEFHFGSLNGFNVEIDSDSAKNLKQIKNPADSSENLAIVEIWGSVYKGNYRTRFIFSTKNGGCLLVGQEVIEVDRF